MKAASFVRRALPAPVAGAPFVVALLALCGQAAGGPTDLHWLTAASGTWEMNTNWTGNQTPNAPTFNAIIDAIGSPYVVSYNSNFTINNLAITPSQASLTFAAGSSLTMQGTYAQGANMVTGMAGPGGSTMDIALGATLTDSVLVGFNLITARQSLTLSGANVTMMWIDNVNSTGDMHINTTGIFSMCDVDIGHGGSNPTACDWGPGAGQILLGMGSTFTNGANSTFTINNASTMGLIPGMGTGSFVNDGMMVKASAGTTDVNGVMFTNTAATGTVQVSAGTLRADTVSNYTAGTQTLTGGKWKIADNAALDFATQTVQVNKADVTLSGAGSAFAAFTNNLNLNDVGGKITIDMTRNLTTAGAFGNKGSVSVGAGSTFAVAPGQNFTSFNTGTNTLTEGVYDLKGKFQFTGANVVNLNADVTLDGAAAGMVNQANANALLQSTAATNTIGAAGKLTIKNGVSFLTGGDMNVAAGGQLTIDTGTMFRVKPGSSLFNITPGGTFNNAGISLRGTLQADNANISLIGAGGSFILDGSGSQLLNGSGMNGFAGLGRIDNGQFTVTAGRALTITNPVTPFTLTGGGGRLTVGPRGPADGPLVQTIVNTTGDFSLEDGILTVDDGILRIEGAGGLTQTGGEIRLLNGGVIEFTHPMGGYSFEGGRVGGTGTVGHGFNARGVITPGASVGTLNVSGDLSMFSTASLEIDLESLASWDKLVISGGLSFVGPGPANVSGTLRVSVMPGFDAAMGTIFEIVSAGSRDGTFASYEGLYFGGGKAFAPIYAFGSVYLEVVPAPGAACALLAGALLTTRRRR